MQEFRRRHIRCKYSQNATVCDRCLQRGALCAGEPPFRFKQVTHIYEKKSGRVASDMILPGMTHKKGFMLCNMVEKSHAVMPVAVLMKYW